MREPKVELTAGPGERELGDRLVEEAFPTMRGPKNRSVRTSAARGTLRRCPRR
jgi:hypothetical protein